MAAITSSNSKFQKLRKTDSVLILETTCAKVHWNWSSRLFCSADTDRRTHARTHERTHARTHIHTHTLGSMATYSVKMTEYKNNNNKKHRQPSWRHSAFFFIDFFKFEEIACFLLFSRERHCNCNLGHQNRVCGIDDTEMSLFPLFPIFLTENYVTEDLHTVIFIISGSK